MKRKLVGVFVFFVVISFPTTSFSFFQLGELNQYISYDRLKVDDSRMLKGRLINETDVPVYVSVRIYFCNIFRAKLNQTSLSLSLGPREKVEFQSWLEKAEHESTSNAHHLEFEIVSLVVGKKNIGRQYLIRG